MLYLATANEIPLHKSVDMSVEEVLPSRDSVRAWFSLPHVRYIGSHSGCSCGFPSIQSETPIGYFEGILAETADRERDLLSINSLLDLIRPLVRSGGEIQLYPIWDLEEDKPPKGTIEWPVDSLRADTFFFHEQFLHRVCS